jgi:cytoplasmic FMR1 interacting protein
MLQMRDICGDWINKDFTQDDYMQKKEALVTANRDFPRRATAPSRTQIVLLRRMVWWICCPKAPGMKGGLFKEKDLKSEWAVCWEHFYRQSFFYTYLLDYHQTVRKLIDMSHLWYSHAHLIHT